MDSRAFVAYGRPIRIIHFTSGVSLHSHDINYKTGSHQQEITGFTGHDDNDYWIVKGKNNGNYRYNISLGELVNKHDYIRFEHVATGKNLHSHPGILSPATGQQEVTGFGENGIGDDGDNWVLDYDTEGHTTWAVGDKVKIKHIATGHYLHSHQNHFTDSGQQEITCFDLKTMMKICGIFHLLVVIEY